MSLDEKNLFLRIQQGETALFDQIVEKYQAKFLRFALSKLNDRETAVDIVQEAFLSAYSARDTYRSEFAVSTWLWTILMNHCRRQWKRAQRRQLESLAQANELCEAEGATSGGLQKLLAQEQSEQLSQLLHDLPEPQSDAIRLRFFGDMSFEEIAVTMQSSLSGAKKRVKQGLLALAEQLRRSEELER